MLWIFGVCVTSLHQTRENWCAAAYVAVSCVPGELSDVWCDYVLCDDVGLCESVCVTMALGNVCVILSLGLQLCLFDCVCLC